jgi:hypothetical protein
MLRNFIYANGLQEADAIIAKKRGWGVFDHFILYMGRSYGQHLFIANDAYGGVKWFSESEVIDLIKDFDPVRIRKFTGNFYERQKALDRAKREIGKSYSLVDFNCEHLANYVQYSVRESKQVQNWKAGLGITAGLLLAAFIFND